LCDGEREIREVSCKGRNGTSLIGGARSLTRLRSYHSVRLYPCLAYSMTRRCGCGRRVFGTRSDRLGRPRSLVILQIDDAS
jgi:hypothetical protein